MTIAQAVKYLHGFSADYDLNVLRGSKHTVTRQRLMLELTGELIPCKKCGVNNLRDKFHEAMLIDTEQCEAVKDMEFKNVCRRTETLDWLLRALPVNEV